MPVSRIVVILFLLLCASGPATATRVTGLYEAEVPVPDQSTAERQQGVVNALRAVLIKLTGDRHAPQKAAVSPVLRRAQQYMQQYRYQEVQVPAAGESARPFQELRIWVRFDEQALNRDLRNLGVPVWGWERPSTLLWLVMDDSEGRDWVTGDRHPDMLALVDARARSRGIVLVYPLFDLEDSFALKPRDVWGGFQGPVLEASDRYQPDAVLTGAVGSPAAGIWEGRWIAYIDGKPVSWETEGILPGQVLEEGIESMADLLATRYVPGTLLGDAVAVRLTVVDVFSVDQYARVLKYLKSLNSVSSLQVSRVEAGQVVLDLAVHGGEEAIAQAIALGRTLEDISGGHDGLYRLQD